jgi:integrase/recombinase XerD
MISRERTPIGVSVRIVGSELPALEKTKKVHCFRSNRKGNKLTSNAMTRSDVLYMIKRRAKAAAPPYSTCCPTFRATGITAYLQNGGTLEHAQQIAAHQSPRTTKLYDRTKDQISLDEVERIKF